ncbi:MAG: DUF1289 domain-containing protein [Rhizobium sp.]
MQTPCVLLCRIDADSGFCLGCGRSLTEIGGWTEYDDAERQAVMAQLPARLEDIVAVADVAG